MKNSETDKFVKDLINTFLTYGRTMSLRDEVRKTILQYVDCENPDFECWKCHTKDITEDDRFCPHCGACA